MFDARYLAFVTISALLVVSPGATMAVVLDTAVEYGSRAALATVVGVNIGNSTLALTSALGMATLIGRWPWMLSAVKICGAGYLTWLGVAGLVRVVTRRVNPALAAAKTGGSALRHLWPRVPAGPADLQGLAAQHRDAAPVPGQTAAHVVRGAVTNWLNPAVILFYMTLLPQFISTSDPFAQRFLVLAGTHVAMSLAWLSVYAVSIGTLSERLARPAVRQTLALVTAVVLIGFGMRLLIG